MKKKLLYLATMAVMTAVSMAGCGKKEDETTTEKITTENQVEIATEMEATAEDATAEEATAEDATATATDVKEIQLEDGVYTVDFDTDSKMFHVNETCEGKATLTVKDQEMTLHITLTSQNIVNLYRGLAEDAPNDEANILQPTIDTVTYEDGTTEEVNGFDVSVPYVGPEFDLALLGTKGVWYDHKVSVSNPELLVEE